MTATGLDSFDTTVQRTNVWLKEVGQQIGSDDKHKAYRATRATLHALRDRLTLEETAQLAAQLPMLVRGFYYEGWDPTGKPLKERHKREFLAQVSREMSPDKDLDPEQAARAVFCVLASHIDSGEIEDVEQVLPSEIHELWPA
ncbi:MAG: hypothetical protein QOF78_242 [Phycisphaerales bacterium]|nr:hypothetical protein [Phycisphaerales bacterium]